MDGRLLNALGEGQSGGFGRKTTLEGVASASAQIASGKQR